MTLKVKIPRKMGVTFLFISTYLVMLLLPLLLGVLIYANSVHVIEEEISQSNETMLNQLRQAIDRRLIDLREMALKVELDTRVTALAYKKAPLDAEQRFAMVGIVRDFRSYLVPAPYIDRFFVYLSVHDIALTPQGTYDAPSLHALWFPNDTGSYTDWFTNITTVKAPQFSLSSSPAEPTLIYLQPFSYTSSETNVGTIAILMRPSAIQESVAAIQTLSQGTVLVIDRNNEILFSSQPDFAPNTLLYDELTGLRGNFQKQVDDELSLISHIASEVTEWKYAYVLPMSIYRTKITEIQQTSLIMLAVILTIGGLLIAYFVRINYNPIVKIVGMLRKNTSDLSGYGHNEYTLIQEIVSGLMREHDRMSSEIEMKNKSLRRLYIASLLQEGAADKESFRAANEQHDFGFSYDFFAVMLFEIEELGGLFEADADVYFIIENVFTELASKTPGAFCETGSRLACLINLSGDTGEKERLLRILKQLLVFFEEKFDILITIALSSVRHRSDDVPEALQEAMDAMEHKEITSSGGIVDYEGVMAQTEPERNFELFLQDEIKLDNLLTNREFTKSRQIMIEVCENLARMKEMPPKDVLRFRMLGLMNTILRALYSIKPLQAKRLVNALNPIKRLEDCQHLLDYRTCFIQVLDEAETYFAAAERKNPLCDDLTAYIKENYSDPNLGLALMADVFVMTESGLSRYFRKKVGIGLLEFIHRTRVQTAKNHLADPALSIKVIAGRVGLDSSDALIRIFKKYEGVTPGAYREILRRNSPVKKKR